MKKLVAAVLALTFVVSGGAAFAGTKKAKADKPKTVQCNVGGQTQMVATTGDCMKIGGLVMNYPGPAPEKAAKKAKKAK